MQHVRLSDISLASQTVHLPLASNELSLVIWSWLARRLELFSTSLNRRSGLAEINVRTAYPQRCANVKEGTIFLISVDHDAAAGEYTCCTLFVQRV